jgi:hypothetical protein
VVRAAVLEGTDEANAEFGTVWRRLEIRYSHSGYDNRRCRLFHWAAYKTVKELAQRRPDGIEEVPAEPGAAANRPAAAASRKIKADLGRPVR